MIDVVLMFPQYFCKFSFFISHALYVFLLPFMTLSPHCDAFYPSSLSFLYSFFIWSCADLFGQYLLRDLPITGVYRGMLGCNLERRDNNLITSMVIQCLHRDKRMTGAEWFNIGALNFGLFLSDFSYGVFIPPVIELKRILARHGLVLASSSSSSAIVPSSPNGPVELLVRVYFNLVNHLVCISSFSPFIFSSVPEGLLEPLLTDVHEPAYEAELKCGISAHTVCLFTRH